MRTFIPWVIMMPIPGQRKSQRLWSWISNYGKLRPCGLLNI